MRQVRLVVLALLAMLAAVSPAAAAPEGQMTWGVHVSLAPTWFDPAETQGIITPFMVMYAIHDALVKAMPGNAAAGTRIQIWDCHVGTNQQWNLNSNGTISNAQNGLFLDVNGAATANGSAVIVWNCHTGANQIWARA